jgi:kinesin family protein C2/C3
LLNQSLQNQVTSGASKEKETAAAYSTALQELQNKLERGIKQARKYAHALENANGEISKLEAEKAQLVSQLSCVDIGLVKSKATDLIQQLQSIKETFLLVRKAAELQKKKIVKILPVLVATITDTINQHTAVAKVTAKQYKKELKMRKQLYNQIQEAKGTVRVYCRVRDFTASETDSTCVPVCLFPQKNTVALENTATGKTESFQFERVFNMSANQAAVFADVQQFVTSMLDGYNVCIIAYGQVNRAMGFRLCIYRLDLGKLLPWRDLKRILD